MLWTDNEFLKFELDVEDGTAYTVKLHFVEFSHKEAGQRAFDIILEDALVLEDFDIYGTVRNSGSVRVGSLKGEVCNRNAPSDALFFMANIVTFLHSSLPVQAGRRGRHTVAYRVDSIVCLVG